MNSVNFLRNIVITDYKVENLIPHLRNDFWDNFFINFTKLGDWYTILSLFIIVSGLLYLCKKRNLIPSFFLVVLGTGIMTVIIKLLVCRTRPGSDIALYVEKLPSFPSAHAALIFVFLGFLIYCFWRFDINLKYKIVLSIVFGTIILLIGFSRIYIGVHYLSDVIGGYLVGLMWVLIAMYISRKSFSIRK